MKPLVSQIFNAEPSLGNPSTDGYVLSSTAAGVRSWVSQSQGGGVTPTSGILRWDTGTNSYQPYITKSAGKFDNGTVDPTDTNRLNYSGYFYSTRLYSNGSQVWDASNLNKSTVDFIGKNITSTKSIVNGGTGSGSTYDATLQLQRVSTPGYLLGGRITVTDTSDYYGDVQLKVKTSTSTGDSDSFYTTSITLKGNNYGYVGILKSSPYYPLDVTGDVNISSGSHYKINGTNLNASNVGAEPALGNPTADNYLLSSTSTGTRSWIPAGLLSTTIQIGSWNMNSVDAHYVDFPTGVTGSKVRRITALIRSDSDTDSNMDRVPFDIIDNFGTTGGFIALQGTRFYLFRHTTGYFKNTNYDSDYPFNRGWITIFYEP